MKPITLTDEVKQEMIQEFTDYVGKLRLIDGEISYKKRFGFKENFPKAKLLFTPEAWLKMQALIAHYDSEVGWHGLVRRTDDNTFEVYDIIVYPQEVTGSTVNTDQKGYEQFLMALTDEQANAMHFHGHSHVNFDVKPSGVDDAHRELIMRSVRKDGFYIFMIINKRNNMNVIIYDMHSNIQYDTEDVEVSVSCIDSDLQAFITNADELVKKRTTAYQSQYQSQKTAPALTASVTGPKKEKKETKKATKSTWEDFEEPDEGYYGIYRSNRDRPGWGYEW